MGVSWSIFGSNNASAQGAGKAAVTHTTEPLFTCFANDAWLTYPLFAVERGKMYLMGIDFLDILSGTAAIITTAIAIWKISSEFKTKPAKKTEKK